MRLPPPAAARLLLAAAAAGVAIGFGACARPGNPRGGVPDRRPPAVIETDPAPGATVTDPGATVRFRFNERVSERPARGTLAEAVVVSPESGAVVVDHGSDWISVRIEGGLRPGSVYRVTLLPVISDLFNNTLRDPFELVFSTGAEMIENALAGQALDRITMRPAPDLTVQLLPPAPQADTVRHVSRTDEAGLYFFRYVPPGVYNLVAFQDRNRNRTRDRTEPWGQRQVRLERDTLFADVPVLEPDTSAATVVRAEAVDSTTLRVEFSDYLDPESYRQTAVILTAPEGQGVPLATQALHPEEYEERLDTAGARADSAQAVPLTAPGQERSPIAVGLRLPSRELIFLLDAPLVVDVEYGVTAQNIVNINRIPLGRGETTVVRRAPPARPAGARPDSTGTPGARADSVVAPGAPPDSAVAPPVTPDTAAVRRDTAAVALRR